MNGSQHPNRREFVRTAVGVAAALPFSSAVRAQVATPPSDRIGLGFIGVGGMGRYHLEWFGKQSNVHVAALCDVDTRHLDQAKAIVDDKDCATYGDFRELLARDDIDAVLVATPDHWHGTIAVAAARAQKDVYCEKPLTNSIGEGRAVADAVAKHGRVLQTGSHERSNPGAAIARQLIRSGRLGDVKTVRVNLPTDSESHHLEVRNTQPPAEPEPIPPELDDDFWIGPAVVTPYAEKRRHFWWRFHHAYGGGEMTDRGAHVIDLVQMILGLDKTGPVEVTAKGERPAGGFYDTFIDFEFENRYADGLRLIGQSRGERGALFEGTEGKLFIKVHGGDLTAEPTSLLEGLEIKPATPYVGHRQEFLAAVRTRGTVIAPAEAGHRTATVCHLNNLAMQLGRPLTWDPVAEQVVNDTEANRHIRRPLRAPWRMVELPS